MTGFSRAIRESLRYKWSLMASVVNALVIGFLWGVSITTIYPFVEVVMQGQTIQTWFDAQVTQCQEAVAKSQKEIDELQQQIANAQGAEAARLQSSLLLARSGEAANEKTLAAYQYFQPWVCNSLPSTAFGALVVVMGLLIAATLLKGICLVIETMLVSRVAGRTVVDMRRSFYRATLEMDQKTLDAYGTSSLMTQIIHNTNLIEGGLETLYGTSVREPLKMLACLVGAALVSWQLLLLSLALAPLGAWLVRFLANRTKRVALSECRSMATILETIMETLNGIKLVKVYNRERTERFRFRQDSQALYRMGLKINFYDALVKPVTELTGIVTIVVAILIGAYLVLNRQTHIWGIPICSQPLSAGGLFVFYAMLAGVADPARKMGDIYTVLVRASAACKGLYGVFEAKPQIVTPPNPKPVPIHNRCIRFEKVRFAYTGDRFVLDDISFEVPFGQTVALVGGNGCGKSTIINLLARFYDPQNGAVLIDDINIRDVNPKKLRRQMAIVTQDPILFQGTVWENIAYSHVHASSEKILAAAKQARVDDYIAVLANGYNTQVGDRGNSLSGGQRQRVALARAILADPRILILDEATSQIDQHSEELVQDTLRGFLAGRTTILVTHRPSTIRLAQRVLMMDHGRIIDDLSATEYLARFAPADLVLPKAA